MLVPLNPLNPLSSPIAFLAPILAAYLLSHHEGKVGSPEKPLSDLGKVSYRSYWTNVILRTLLDTDENMTIRELSDRTAIQIEDIISTLQALHLIKYWKGQHVVSVSRPLIEGYLAKNRAPLNLAKPECLRWTPPGKGGRPKE